MTKPARPTGAGAPQAPPDARRLAVVRERFLAREPFEAGAVRDIILASWQRSIRWNVQADNVRVQSQETDLESPLARSAEPVLTALTDNLHGQPVSVILTDARGVVLSRRVDDKVLARRLDRVLLAPGFSYAEEYVGTNGIGTALEGGRPIYVHGHEHYAEYLEDLACAAVPIRHPISGKTVGVIDLTCWREDAGQLLPVLAKTTSDQIRQSLLMDCSQREYELLQAYVRTCRRGSGIVVARQGDVTMLNDQAQLALGPTDQSVVLQELSEALASSVSGPIEVDLPSGGRVRMRCHRVGPAGADAGGVARLEIQDSTVSRVAPARQERAGLPGVAGTGTLWVRACQEIDAAFATGAWFAVEGEPGVGKLAAVRAVHQRRSPAGTLRVLECNDATDHAWIQSVRRELANPQGHIVVRHVDTLDGPQLRLLTAALVEARRTPDPPGVCVTTGERPSPAAANLLDLFPRTIRVPPLRHHIEDLAALVPFLLSRLSSNQVSCSATAMRLLSRSVWPGNVGELHQVLREVLHRRRAGVIEGRDLPAQVRSVSRRVLTPIEALERDAIIEALAESQGNKQAAASALGMSRATIYRKIKDYGVTAV